MKLTTFLSGKTLAMTALLASSFSLSLPAAYAGPSAEEYGTVLNLSGKQRMLTQKMSKEAMFVALGVNVDKNLQSLESTVNLFDKTLDGLHHGSAELGLPPTESGRIVRQLTKIEELWTSYEATMRDIVASGSVTAEHVNTIKSDSVPLLKAMNKAVGLYEKDAQASGLESDPSLATTINLSGKQRMLSQKMTKELLIFAYDQGKGDSRLALLETTALFDRTLKGLRDGDSNLDLPGTSQTDILDQLGVVSGIWADFKGVIEAGVGSGGNISDDNLQTLESDNITLLKEMNKAVGMYADLAA